MTDTVPDRIDRMRCKLCAGPPRALPIVLVLATSLGVSGRLVAQEAEHQDPESREESGERGEEEKKNEFAVFIGSTEAEVEDGEKEDRDFTIGLDYERRLTRRVGIGGLYDWVAEGNREFLIGVPIFLHPGKAATLQVAPCVQRIREDKEINFVMRLGFSWGFDVGKIRIVPEIFYDIAEGQDFVVFGVAFGKEF